MNPKIFAALTMILGIALSTSAFAQGRHDEKPHGMGKPATATQESKETRIATGGRHDAGVTTHGTGKKKPARTIPWTAN
ncbi:MAG: hypothetical protein HYU44_06385 [Betaproteobacteria bacterium]|nr:hypothetical protein [Betaproteobacteria bacterium]MBI3054596.1 hypothetical protein [Betaproteobacteria bacterium]